MITLEKVKFIREKKSDNPDQLNLFGDNSDKKNKKNKAQQYTDKINKANKNRKEFDYAKSKESKTFKGTVTQGADKGRSYTVDRNPAPKGSRKGIPINKPKDIPIEKSNRAIGDLFKRYGRGEPKATQFVIDMSKDDRKARGLGKRAERIKGATGGKTTGSLRKGNLSFPGDRTGAYSTTKSQIDFNKALKKARGNTEGDIPAEAPKSVKDYAKGVRDKRIKKLKLPDTSFDSKTKAKTKFDDIFKGVKKQKFKSGGQTQFDISKTPVGKLKLPSPTVSPEAKRKRFDALSKDISKFSKRTRIAGSDIKDLKDVDKATMRTGPIKKGAVPDNTTRYDVGMASRKITKKYAPGTTGKVQMRGGATNIPSGPKTPPKTYNIPPDDSPGKLAQGRDFPSKKAYDAKLEKQVKILRGKADNLRKKQIKIAKTNPAKDTPEYEARRKGVRKIGARMKERRLAADALEKSLKRKGTIGPTSMLPVVSGKGADVEMPGMGGKTYKQFYKDANVGKQYKPPKIKPIPKPDSNRVFNVNKVIRKKAVANVGKSKAGLGLGAKALKFAKGMTLGKAAIGAGLAYAGYEGIKYLTRRRDLSKDEIGTTSTIQTNSPKYKTTSKDKSDPKGVVFKNPTFSDSQKGTRKNREDTGYINPDKSVNPAIFRGGKSFLSTRSATKQEPLLNKFRNKEFYVTGAPKNKDGSAFNIDKNMRGSAFEKQLKDAKKGTGRGYNPFKKDFLQRKQTRKDRNFLRKYKDAARPTPLTTK